MEDPQYVGAERHTNGVAELAAQVFASLWIIQSGIQQVHLRYDAMYAENVADAMAKPGVNMTLAKVAVGIRGLAASRATLDSSHVFGHSSDPWNELEDVACDAASRRGVGFACCPLPVSLSRAIVGDPDSLRWLGLTTLQGNEAAQYPPGIGVGRLDYLQGWSHGFETDLWKRFVRVGDGNGRRLKSRAGILKM